MKKKQVSLLRSDLDTLLSMNLFVCVVTYAILVVYCIICLRLASNGDSAGGEPAEFFALQFYMDAIFPSTLTLVISMIIQSLLAKTKQSGWLIPLAPIPITVIYTMVCVAFRQINSVWQFVGLMFFSVALVVGCFGVAIWIQQSKKIAQTTDLCIS